MELKLQFEAGRQGGGEMSEKFDPPVSPPSPSSSSNCCSCSQSSSSPRDSPHTQSVQSRKINKECRNYLLCQMRVALDKWPEMNPKEVKTFLLTGHQKYNLALLNQATLLRFISVNVSLIKETTNLTETGLSPLISTQQAVPVSEKPLSEAVICNPKYPVSEELQQLIISENPGRNIIFIKSQRNNTQLVLDDFILKKKKGPLLQSGGLRISWRCVDDGCRFTATTWEGHLKSSGAHSHPPQPELYIKKVVRSQLREDIASERAKWESQHVSGLIQNMVQGTEDRVSQVLNKENDALKQFARRFKRKIAQNTKTSQEMETQSREEGLDSEVTDTEFISCDVKGEEFDENYAVKVESEANSAIDSFIAEENIKVEDFDESLDLEES